MLLGMLQWMVILGKSNICQLVSSLNRFGAYPREGHLNLAVSSFGYVKTTINTQIDIDSRLLYFARTNPDFKKIIPDFIQDYSDTKEDLDSGFPKVFTSYVNHHSSVF